MNDQAEHLRRRLKQSHSLNKARTIAIASGKGGVGKSNFTINFALKLIEKGKKVLVFDMDIGMGNIDILLGLSTRHTFIDLFREGYTVHDIIEQGPNSLSFIAGGSGLADIFQLDNQKFEHFQNQFEQLIQMYDYILFDMGAGATHDSLHLISAADEAIVVTTPEPTSITDAYAMIKHLMKKDEDIPISILVNRAMNASDNSAYTRLQTVVERFLNKQVNLCGVIPDGPEVTKAVTSQTPFVLAFPASGASKAMGHVVLHYLSEKENKESPIQTSSFLSKLKRFVFER